MRDEIRERILGLLGGGELRDDEPLVVSGRLNSVKVIELATWLEEKFHISFDGHVFHVHDFNTVDSVVELVKTLQVEN
jgi:acyl carrier protein